jgi:putative membrane protein
MKSVLLVLKKPEGWAFLVLAGFTVLSTLGYWNFVIHPERLPTAPLALKVYSVSFKAFAQLHIVLAAVALGVLLVRRIGFGWWPALLAVYCLSFMSEHMGTGYGIPFGGYEYTGLLGVKLGGRVPALIPLSWFLMALPSWLIARAATAGATSRVARVALGALWLTVWDLALDPAMSYLTPYWVWQDSGPYYGMPWVNLAGWYATGLVLMGALEIFSSRTGLADLPLGWMVGYYVLIVLLPLGMVAAAGLWIAALVTLLGMALAAGATLIARGASESSDSTSRSAHAPAGVR